MIDASKTLILLNVDILQLKSQSAVKVYWRCDSCGVEKLKAYRDCIKSTGLCSRCSSIKRGHILGNKFGKSQVLHGKCLYCDTPIRSQHVVCRVHKSEHLKKIYSGSNNPAWKGTNVCGCGNRKSTGASMCRQCSFTSGKRSGSNNGRWVKDRGKIMSAKIARNLLSNTLKSLGLKKTDVQLRCWATLLKN